LAFLSQQKSLILAPGFGLQCHGIRLIGKQCRIGEPSPKIKKMSSE
jgi:hypothetical protein